MLSAELKSVSMLYSNLELKVYGGGGGGLCGVCVWGQWGIGSDFGIRGRVSPENGWVFRLLSHSEGFMQVS